MESGDSDRSESREGDSYPSERRQKKIPRDGVLEATILKNFTDTTMDVSLLEAEAHNAVLVLSDKVRKEIKHSAVEMRVAL